MGTDNLFEQHTVKEIQDIEKKLRNDIERKKEELRQMVGERYRDLMEAADTITEMKDIARNVTLHINTMEKHCVKLQSCSIQIGILNSVKSKVSERKKQNEMLYSITAQIRILMDTPAKIWQSLENKDYLSGMLIYLLARHTHASLLLDPIYQEQAVLDFFPVINRQWLGINHLQHILLQHCQNVFSTLSVDLKEITGALLCFAFLSDLSPRMVFQNILKTRKIAIKDIFKQEKHGYAAKAQICELVCAVQNTLKIFYAVFYPVEEDLKDFKTNMLLSELYRITSKHSPGPMTLFDLQSAASFKYLPEIITEFRPVLKAANDVLSIDDLQHSCKQWIQEVKTSVKCGLEKSLEYVKSAKALALIRDSVTECNLEMKHWDKICTCLMEQDFVIWDSFLKFDFLDRIKHIIDIQVESSANLCCKSTEDIIGEFVSNTKYCGNFEMNISTYLWLESSTDVLPNVGWIPHHQRQMWDDGTLIMKVHGFAPKIQSICKEVDKKLQILLEDASCFIQHSQNRLDSITTKANLKVLDEDTIEICNHLSSVTEKYFMGVINHFQEMCSTLSNSIQNSEKDIETRIVFLGHLFYALSKLCPHLKLCILSANLERLDPLPMQAVSSYFQLGSSKEGHEWESFTQKLVLLSNQAFRMWSEKKISSRLMDFKSLMKFKSASDVLKTLIQWDKVEIQEESEDGNSVKSILKVPQQVSMPLFNTLYLLCCDLNEIGGHAISSLIRTEICKHLFDALLDVYKFQVSMQLPTEQMSPRLVQTMSLQMLFDVQFLMSLIGSHESGDKSSLNAYENVLSQIVSHIDPFDLDVFSTPLKANIKKALQKSSLLLGLLVSPDQIGHLSNLKAQSLNSQTEHSLMICSNVTNRFPLLPLASRSQQSLPPPNIVHGSDVCVKGSPLKAARSHSSSPNLSASDNPLGVSKSASFYDRVTAMSSSWFGGS